MFRNIFLFLIFVFINNSTSIVVYDCGSTWEISQVTLDDCEEDVVECPITRNSTALVSVEAPNVQPFAHIETTASLVLYGSTFDVPISPEPCDQWPCPFNAVGNFQYNGTVTIENKYPLTSAVLYLKGTLDSGDFGVCVGIRVIIQR